MKTLFALLFSLSMGFAVEGARRPERAEQVRGLVQQYGRDDQQLAAARHFARTDEEKEGTIRQEAWVLETGELLKVAREQRRAGTMERDEYSFDAQGDVYFAFHRVDEKQADGGMKVTEHRTYVENGNPIAMRRRDAGPEWARVKAVKGTLSPDGRYAVAIEPTGKKIDWAEYQDKELGNDVYTLDTDGVDNVIVDFRTHRVVGKTLGKYFGTRASYNHRSCSVAWSPDARFFVQVTDDKWYTETASIGRVEDGKLVGVLDLLKAAKKRGAEFLVTSKNKVYREHGKAMEVALSEPKLNNDGSGSAVVIFQVPKSIDIQLVIRFRLIVGKGGLQLEMLDVKRDE